jgi:hypothetical protein
MKKMMLLASVMGLVALMLAAAPAFAQQDRVTICHIPPGNPANAHTITVGAPAVDAHRAHGDFLGECEDRDNVDRDRDRDRFDEFDVFDEPFISQDIEQEAESGDIDQDFDVSQTGDNSNQTVGIQGTANTGNAQNAIGVIDAGDFGDFDGDNRRFIDDEDDCFSFDGRFICDDFDGDNRRIFDDDFNVFDNNDTDFEIEDSGAKIDMSPTNTVNSHQEVNQAAAASAPQWVWTAWGWMLV